jgi:hypothetical protein
MNAVDTGCRMEFRKLFDANFGQARAEMATGRAEKELLRLELHAETRQLESRADARLADLKSELLGWMFLCWIGTIGAALLMLKL